MQDVLVRSEILGNVSDELKISEDEAIKNFFELDESIIFSGSLIKINKHEARQKRYLVITDKNIYNVHPHDGMLSKLAFKLQPKTAMKRKIPISKLYGLTIRSGSESNEFVIHVKDEHDYRYESSDKKEAIIKALCCAYYDLEKKALSLYMTGVGLSEFHTTDDDLKAGINKKPVGLKMDITPEILKKGFDWIMDNSQDLMKGSQIFWEKEKRNNDTHHRNPGSSIEQNPGQDWGMEDICPNPEDAYSKPSNNQQANKKPK